MCLLIDLKKILVYCLLLVSLALPAQSSTESEHHNLLRLSLGLGYDDALALLAQTPSLGISYEYRLNRYFSIAGHLFSYYRTMPDSYFDRSLNGGRIIVDLIAPGLAAPLASPEELEKISKGAIQLLAANRTIKMLSLPVDLGLTVYPLQYRAHKLGLNLAFSMTYESSNWPRDYFEPVRITLEDGTTYDQAFLSVNTEFRYWTPGASVKLIYAYHFQDYALGFRAGNYNVFFFGDANHSVWETSIYFGHTW